MDVKKRKDFTVKKEDNKEDNNNSYKFVFFFVSLLRRGKIKFYNAAVQRFLKGLENLQGNFCDGDQNGLSHACRPISFLSTSLWLLPNIEQKCIPLNYNIVWCKNSRVVIDLSNNGSFSLLTVPK